MIELNMSHNVYQTPDSGLNQKGVINQKIQIFWLKRCIFILLLIIAIPGVLSTIWAILYLPNSLIIFILGLLTCSSVFLGMLIIFSKWGENYSRLKWIFVIVSILFIYNAIISFLGSCLYGVTCDWPI
jgi:hypothetical protein